MASYAAGLAEAPAVPGTRHRSPLAARVVPALVAVALLTGTGASVARASFRRTAAASTTVGSSTVTPPTGLTAGPCTGVACS